jgi:SSS family solute:Na+ symporter
MALWSYTMYGAGITPALIAALVWPRATPQAGTTSIAAGMLVTLLWEIVARSRGNATAPQYLLGLQTIYPALAASVGTLVLLTIKPAFAGSRFAGSRAR